jgi:hypothetical protein
VAVTAKPSGAVLNSSTYALAVSSSVSVVTYMDLEPPLGCFRQQVEPGGHKDVAEDQLAVEVHGTSFLKTDTSLWHQAAAEFCN